MPANPPIFISYRIADSLPQAGRLHQSLEAVFGKGTVFFDKKNLPPGVIWDQVLEENVGYAAVVLMVYKDGKSWMGASVDEWNNSKRRIDDPTDWVRREVETALSQGKLAIPVLINEARLPPENILPEPLRPILKRQGWPVREAFWESDLQMIISEIKKVVPPITSATPTPPVKIFDKKTPTELDCYCCNRDVHFQEVMAFLEGQKAAEQLHIFLPSLHHDAPESFVTRLVHRYFPKNDFHFPDFHESRAASGEHIFSLKKREKKLELPFRATAEIQQDIEAEATALVADNLAFFYKIDLKNWKTDHCSDFFGHLAGGKLAIPAGKKIRFFYWIDVSGCHRPDGFLAQIFRKKDLVAQAKSLCAGSDFLFFSDHLPHVEHADLSAWFADFCFNTLNYNHLIQSLFPNQQPLPMAKVENLLFEQFQNHNRYRP